jgi:hypothetical protein
MKIVNNDILQTVLDTKEFKAYVKGFKGIEGYDKAAHKHVINFDGEKLVTTHANYRTHFDIGMVDDYKYTIEEDHWGTGYTHPNAKSYVGKDINYIVYVPDKPNQVLGYDFSVEAYYYEDEIIWWSTHED